MPHPYQRIVSMLSCLLLCSAAGAQSSAAGGFGIESNFMSGRIIRHSKKIIAPIPDHSSAFELNFIRQTDGRKAWQQRRHYPLIGLGITYTDYGNDAIFGRCFGLYPNIQVPLIRGRRLEWTLRLGFGLGYVTRHYSRTDDYDTLNTAIGSRINNFTLLSTDLRYRVSRHIDVQAGMNFSHISNAAFKQPNLGINMYGAHIGIRYFPVTAAPERIRRQLAPLRNRWLVQARAGIAFNESGYSDGPLYPAYLASLYASKRWHSHNKAFAGIDYSYHKRIEAFLKNNEIMPGREKANSWKSGVFAGNEFLIGRVGFLVELGYYLRQSASPVNKIYEKLGGNFYLVQQERGVLKELCVSALLKAHQVQAELVELGFAVGF